jgi:hypothetical protein
MRRQASYAASAFTAELLMRRSAAAGAKAGDLEPVAGRDEPMLGRGVREPLLEPAFAELDHAVAARADEVMVVVLAAPAVAELARVVRKNVDRALAGQARERAVDGRQAEAFAALLEPRVKLLGRDVIVFVLELRDDRDALRRGPHAGMPEGSLGGLPPASRI